jgi:hypothetical protein
LFCWRSYVDVAQPMDVNHSIVILTNNFIHRILQSSHSLTS